MVSSSSVPWGEAAREVSWLMEGRLASWAHSRCLASCRHLPHTQGSSLDARSCSKEVSRCRAAKHAHETRCLAVWSVCLHSRAILVPGKRAAAGGGGCVHQQWLLHSSDSATASLFMCDTELSVRYPWQVLSSHGRCSVPAIQGVCGRQHPVVAHVADGDVSVGCQLSALLQRAGTLSMCLLKVVH